MHHVHGGKKARVEICIDPDKTTTTWHKQLYSKYVPALYCVSAVFLAVLVGYEIWKKSTSGLPGAMRLCTIVHILLYDIISTISPFLLLLVRNPNTSGAAGKSDYSCSQI